MRTLGFWQSLLRRSLAPYLLAFLILTVIGIWSARTGLIPGIQSGDDKDQYMPGRAFSAEVLRSGSLPEWNPFIYTGYPHIADVQNGFFYPPNLILYQLFSPSTAHNLSIAFNVFLIVFFTSHFLRLFVKSAAAVWIGSATFALAGFLCYSAATVTIPDSAAWIPAVFWCVEKWIRTARWRYCAWGGLCLVMQLFAGWPQMVLLTAIYLGVYLLFVQYRPSNPFKVWMGILVMGLLAAGSGMPQLLATLQLKDQSILEHLSYPDYAFGSVAPQLIILLFFPFLVGAGFGNLPLHKVAYYAPISGQVNVYYVGILPLMLALAAVLLWRRSRYVRYGIASALLALLLAWGGYTPLGRLLYRLPVYNFFHDHRINLVFFDFAIAILAACALEGLDFSDLSPAGRRRLSWVLPASVIATAALLLVHARALLGSMDPKVSAMPDGWLVKLHQTMRFDNPDVTLPIVLLFAAGALFYNWVQHPGSKRIAIFAVAFVIADLAYFGIGGQWLVTFASASPDEQAALTMMRGTAGHNEFRSLSLVKWFYPAISPNLTGEYRHADILGLGPFLPKRHSGLLTSLNVGEVRHWRELMINNTVLSLLNTRFIEIERSQLAEINRILGPLQPPGEADSPAKTFSASSPANLVERTVWSAGAGRTSVGPPVSLPACARKQCEIAGVNLSLEPDSAYELSFKTKDSNPTAGSGEPGEPGGIGGGFRTPTSSEYFSINDWMFKSSRAFNLYTYVYLTDKKPAETSVMLINFRRSPVDLKEVSLRKIGSFPLAGSPYRLAGQYGGLFILENMRVYPRAFFVSDLQPVSSFEEARSQLWRTVEPFDARHTAVVEAPANQLPSAISEGTVDRLAYSPNRAELEVSCPGTCYLVLSDMYYPGWAASIDKQPTTIYLTDAMVRGIVVPAGAHHVEFAYHPRWFRMGLLVSLATLALVTLMTFRSGKSRIPDTSNESARR